MNKIDLADLEPFRFGTPPDIWVAWVVLTLAMIGYWRYRCGRARVLTFDVFFVGLYLYVPIAFMSVFAFSPWNQTATGEWWPLYVPKVREAFYVSLLGAGMMLFTAWVAARNDRPPLGFRLVHHTIRDFWARPVGLRPLVGTFVALGAVVVATVGIVSARENAMTHTEFRPASHLFSTFGVIAIYLSLIEGYRQKSWRLSALGVALTLALLGFGTRKVTVGTLVYYLAMRLIMLRTRRRWLLIGLSGLGAVILVTTALGVEFLRDGDYSMNRLLVAPVSLMFGNNLSELRDFAWMLSAWNQEPLLGTTYGSGLLSFIPSFLLPQRRETSWATFSTHMTGLDEGNHPGLRPTLFAEAYFNFGLAGVIAYALVMGLIFGRLTAFVERRLGGWPPRERAVPLLCAFLYFEFFLRCQQSANCFQSYIDLVLLFTGVVGAWICEQYRTRRALQPTTRRPGGALAGTGSALA